MDAVGASRPALPVPTGGAKSREDAEILKAAKDFEAMFIGTVVNEMLKTSAPKTMNGGVGEEMFMSMLGNAVGERIAESGGVGIAANIATAMRAYKE